MQTIMATIMANRIHDELKIINTVHSSYGFDSGSGSGAHFSDKLFDDITTKE